MSEELQNPFVIQCKDCRRILADSFSLIAFKNNYLILSNVSSSVYTNEKKVESTTSYDAKCHYLLIYCECSKAVGKKYITVNEAMKDCIDKYCVNREFVYSFLLGAETPKQEITLSALAEEVTKLQRFCITLYKRIQKDR